MKLVKYAIVLMLGAVVCRWFGMDRAAHILSLIAGLFFVTFLVLLTISVMRQKRF